MCLCLSSWTRFSWYLVLLRKKTFQGYFSSISALCVLKTQNWVGCHNLAFWLWKFWLSWMLLYSKQWAQWAQWLLRTATIIRAEITTISINTQHCTKLKPLPIPTVCAALHWTADWLVRLVRYILSYHRTQISQIFTFWSLFNTQNCTMWKGWL